MLLDVVGEIFATIETLFELGMGNISPYYDGTREGKARRYGVFG